MRVSSDPPAPDSIRSCLPGPHATEAPSPRSITSDRITVSSLPVSRSYLLPASTTLLPPRVWAVWPLGFTPTSPGPEPLTFDHLPPSIHRRPAECPAGETAKNTTGVKGRPCVLASWTLSRTFTLDVPCVPGSPVPVPLTSEGSDTFPLQGWAPVHIPAPSSRGVRPPHQGVRDPGLCHEPHQDLDGPPCPAHGYSLS